jgi:hypothetical protein
MWTPEPLFKELLDYVKQHGITPFLLKTRLLRLALSDNNQMASIKAIEVLRDWGTSNDNDSAQQIDPREFMVVARLLNEAIKDGGKTLYDILADIGLAIEAEGTEGDSATSTPFPPGLRKNGFS